jgi:hypothetical protein
MKPLIKQVTSLLLVAMMIVTSCIKRDESPQRNNAQYPIMDTLSGKEIQFDNLIWDDHDNIERVYLLISRPDLFMYPRNIVVLLRTDTSSAWIPALKGPVNSPFNGFVYSIGSGNLHILSYPANISLLGMSASVRIKF